MVVSEGVGVGGIFAVTTGVDVVIVVGLDEDGGAGVDVAVEGALAESLGSSCSPFIFSDASRRRSSSPRPALEQKLM